MDEHGEDLRDNRTPADSLFKVDKLLDTSSSFTKAVLNLGSATIFIEEQDDTFFQYLDTGKEFFNSAVAGVSELKGFVE